MRYPASEKLEIIHLVERSHLPIKQTLDKLGIPRTTFYRWYDRYQVAGPEALEDQSPRPSHVWNRIPDDVRQRIVDLALDVPELSPRELAVRFTDTEKYFVSDLSSAENKRSPPGTPGLSLSSRGNGDRDAQPGLVRRHHLHPCPARLPLPGRYHGLGDPPCARLAAVEQHGCLLLHRGAG